MILEVKDLSIGFHESIKDNITFSLNEGEVLVIEGSNGSGKSTLIKTLLGDLSAFNGYYKWNLKNQEISYLTQFTNLSQQFAYTVEEILNAYSIPIKFRVFFNEEILKRKWVDCSGGEKQKLLILTRLSKDAKIIILDEPFNHLDLEAIDNVKGFLLDLIKTKIIKAIIVVSHIEFTVQDIKTVKVKL